MIRYIIYLYGRKNHMETQYYTSDRSAAVYMVKNFNLDKHNGIMGYDSKTGKTIVERGVIPGFEGAEATSPER